MKKISIFIAVILSFTMILSLSACGSENLSVKLDETYEKIDELNDKINDLTQRLDDLSNSDSSTSSYTVKFITQGTLVEDSKSSIIEYAPNTIKENYNFIGWYYDIYYTRPVSFPLSVNTDMTLYAKFVETRDSLADRFDDYVQSLPEKKLVLEYPILDTEYITTIGDYITINSSKEIVQESFNYTITEKYDIQITFEYGKLGECFGLIQYSKTKQGTGIYDHYNETRTIDSVVKEGSFYKLISRITSQYNGYDDIDTDYIHNKIIQYVDYSLSDLLLELSSSGYEDTILYY